MTLFGKKKIDKAKPKPPSKRWSLKALTKKPELSSDSDETPVDDIKEDRSNSPARLMSSTSTKVDVFGTTMLNTDVFVPTARTDSESSFEIHDSLIHSSKLKLTPNRSIKSVESTKSNVQDETLESTFNKSLILDLEPTVERTTPLVARSPVPDFRAVSETQNMTAITRTSVDADGVNWTEQEQRIADLEVENQRIYQLCMDLQRRETEVEQHLISIQNSHAQELQERDRKIHDQAQMNRNHDSASVHQSNMHIDNLERELQEMSGRLHDSENHCQRNFHINLELLVEKRELEHTLDRDDRAIQNGSDRPFRDDRPTFV